MKNVDTFDIELKRYYERQPNVDFLLNGRVVYGIRFRKLESSFDSLIEWINDFNRYRERPPRTVWVKEDGISVFISCKYLDDDEADAGRMGRFSVGDDWEGEAFSLVAPIETVVDNIYQRLREYYLNYPTDFSQELKDVGWD